MQFYVDLGKLDCFLSTIDEELREISRLEGIFATQKLLSDGSPEEAARILERSRFLKHARESAQGRKQYLMKAQELLFRAEKSNQASLEALLQYLRRQCQ
jgi:hypothetical protein